MIKERLITRDFYVAPWEFILGITYLMTFTAVSVGGINISDKLCFGIIAVIPLLKWARMWIDVLIKEYIALFIWVTISMIVVLLVAYPWKDLMFTINYMLQIMVVTSFTIIFSQYDVDYFRIFKFLYQIAVICAAIGILQYYFFDSVTKIIATFVEAVYIGTWNGMPRVGSLFDNPVNFAVISGYSFILGIILWIYERKPIYLIENLIIAYGLFCSGSRGPVIGILFGLCIIFILSFKVVYKIPSGMRYIFVTLCGVVGIFLFVKLLQGGSRFDLIFQGIAEGDWSHITNQRTDIWKNLLSYMPGHWVFGLGNGVSGVLSNFAEGYGSHSLYIGLLVETGICGLSLFILFIVSTYYIAQKYLEKPQERLCFFVIFSVMQVTQISEMLLDHVYQYIFWFWLIASMPYSAKRKKLYKNGDQL